MTGERKRLVLLDAHAIIHRAYHALPDFRSSAGEPTGAIYGLGSMLLRLIKDLEPDCLAACFDRPEKTFREEKFADYKAKRPKVDEDLVIQLERSRDLFSAFGIPIIDYRGFEADDIIGTIVFQNKDNPDLEIIISSGDMDTLQLVEGDRVKVWTLRKGITDSVMYDEKAVRERFGFGPKLISDFKGLRGDPSDNIPGIRGIGEKTASILIQEFGSIEEIYEKLSHGSEEFQAKGIKERIINLLKGGEDEARFSKELATIRQDAPVSFECRAWQENFVLEKADNFFAEFGFKSLRERLKNFYGSQENMI